MIRAVLIVPMSPSEIRALPNTIRHFIEILVSPKRLANLGTETVYAAPSGVSPGMRASAQMAR